MNQYSARDNPFLHVKIHLQRNETFWLVVWKKVLRWHLTLRHVTSMKSRFGTHPTVSCLRGQQAYRVAFCYSPEKYRLEVRQHRHAYAGNQRRSRTVGTLRFFRAGGSQSVYRNLPSQCSPVAKRGGKVSCTGVS